MHSDCFAGSASLKEGIRKILTAIKIINRDLTRYFIVPPSKVGIPPKL